MPATLLILAGGDSRRMGRSKATLPVRGRTLVEFVADRLAAEFAELVVSANDPALVPPALAQRARIVRDLHPAKGPLAGIEAGLMAAGHGIVLAVACDMPNVTPALARRLVRSCEDRDAAVPVVGGRPEPVCAAYATSAGHAVRAALDSGRRRAGEVLDRLDVAWVVDVNPDEVQSLNTPEEYRRFLDALR